MITKYREYTAFDFIEDEYFRKSILLPTEKTDAFWNKLLEDQSINEAEYTEARNILTGLYPRQIQDISDERSQLLWERIGTSTKTYKHKRAIRKYLSIAASSAAIIIFAFLALTRNNSSESLMDQIAQADISNIMDTISDVQLVLSTNTIQLEGDDTNLDYTHSDSVSVNNTHLAKDQSTLNQLIVPYGKRSFLVLEDGSKIWVNAGSHIIFPSKFASNKREIFIKGEIYAEIAKDAKRPFQIISDNIHIEVLGTSLNVSDYKEDASSSVVLIEGSVRVGAKSKSSKLSLIKPNQKYSLTNEQPKIESVNAADYITWKDGLYHFKNKPLKEIMRKIEKYYNIQVLCERTVADILCTGSINLKDDPTQLIDGICYSASINSEKKPTGFRIYQ